MTQQKPEFLRAELVRAVLDGEFGERIPRVRPAASSLRWGTRPTLVCLIYDR
jgi:hypothetical protein